MSSLNLVKNIRYLFVWKFLVVIFSSSLLIFSFSFWRFLFLEISLYLFSLTSTLLPPSPPHQLFRWWTASLRTPPLICGGWGSSATSSSQGGSHPSGPAIDTGKANSKMVLNVKLDVYFRDIFQICIFERLFFSTFF